MLFGAAAPAADDDSARKRAGPNASVEGGAALGTTGAREPGSLDTQRGIVLRRFEGGAPKPKPEPPEPSSGRVEPPPPPAPPDPPKAARPN